ncbi:MAG: isoprenylcysteine carboxylmethyltransferase family protein [Candidatus Binatia bacterium]
MPPSKEQYDSSTLLKNVQLILFLLITLVLMIQGWGDRGGFLHHPARAGFLAVFALSVLFLLFVPFTLFGEGDKEIPRQRWLTYGAVGVVGGLCWYLPYADRYSHFVWPENEILRYGGLVATTLGMAVRITCMAQLGRLFSGFVTVQHQHVLISTGAYRWVRHPIYAGSLLAFAGFFLIFRSKLILIAFPLYLLGTLWRIVDEERLLAEVFGKEYKRYQARTWRLFPFIY